MTQSTLSEIRDRDIGLFSWKDDAYTSQAVMDRHFLLGVIDELLAQLHAKQFLGMQVILNPGIPPGELRFLDHNGNLLGKIVGLAGSAEANGNEGK